MEFLCFLYICAYVVLPWVFLPLRSEEVSKLQRCVAQCLTVSWSRCEGAKTWLVLSSSHVVGIRLIGSGSMVPL